MAKLHELGIDYVTITEKHAGVWSDIMAVLEKYEIPALHKEGHEYEHKRTMGYQGVQLGPMFWGGRHDGSMLRVSGSTAGVVLGTLLAHVKQLHVTRIDIQATIAFEADRMLYAEEAKAQVLHHQETVAKRSHPNVTLISTAGRGDTLQIGSRSSEVYCRIYDKMREQKFDYEPYTWRFEVECKGSIAAAVVERLRLSQQWDTEVLSLVRGTFELRGVQEPALQSSKPIALASKKVQTDNERRLKWIESDVAPTIRRLWEQGYQEELLALFAYMC